MNKIVTKKLQIFSVFLLSFLFFHPLINYSQNNLCSTADPFCTGTTYNFPAGVNAGTAQSGPSYSCLGSEPNPAWYYLQIANPGPLEIHMVGGNSTNDIDFVCWGPFPNLAGACTNLTGGVGCSSHHASGSGGGYPSGNVVDCSYDASAEEWCYIPNGVTGQVYMLMITNYSNSACNIIFSQSGGTGSTDCSILAPPITNNGPLCVGQTLNFTVTNPTNGATYNWTGPNGYASSTMNPSIPNVTLANAGTYSMTITVGGQTSQPVTSAVVINANPVADAGLPQSICSGTTATLTASGGTGYTWSSPPGGTTASITDSPTATTTYTVTVTNNGCSATDDVTITVNPLPTPTATPTPASCGLSNGSAIATGGVGYLWSDNQPVANAVNLSAATYQVTVTDANGCTASTSCTVTNNLGGNVTVTSTDEHCGHSDGTATATSVGGTAPFTYLWSNGLTTGTITGLPAGNYTVTTSDAIGCTASATATVVNVAGPSLQILSVTNESCTYGNGTATVDGSSGTAPYTYLWVNGNNTATATNLSAGSYGVTVTDANGCTALNTVAITNTPGPTLMTSTTLAGCTVASGTATANANSGLQPYTYLWSDGASQATQTAVNLMAGTYTVTVTDANSCTITASAIINITTPPTLNTGTTLADCGQADGTANVNTNGGIQPYTYLWSDGASQITQTAVNLISATYTVTVTDANGCSASASATVNTTNIVTATATSTLEYCDRQDGTVTAHPASGSGTYTYLWSNGQTTQTATGLPHGTYTVTVSDGFCSASASVSISMIPGPTAGFTVHPPVTNLMGGPVSFSDHSTGNNISWVWDFGDGSPSGSGIDPKHQYINMGTFIVTEIITDNNGCTDTIQDSVKVKEIFSFYIPNAFTPNTDGLNDLFLPRGINVDPDNYEMAIFDRWGKLMFITTNPNEGWNGTYLNKRADNKIVMGVFVYRIRLKEIDGPKHEYLGRISLIP